MNQELSGPHAPYMLIVYAIAEKIRSGELRPGDRVPSVTELVGTYVRVPDQNAPGEDAPG
jgi:DNA-binding GntR family transcriptional regulator